MLILFGYIIFFKIEKNDYRNPNFELLLKTLFIIYNFFDLLYILLIIISLRKSETYLFGIKILVFWLNLGPYISFILYIFYKYNQ